jgi:hypothetical protein
MTQQNLISINIPEEDMALIEAAITTLKEKLLPYLKTLSTEESRQLPKVGDKSIAFVAKTLEYCKSNPELVPRFLDVKEFIADVRAMEILRLYYATLLQITDSLSDSIIMAGSDAYAAALMFYNTVQYAAKTKEPKAATIFEDLSNRFSGKKKTKDKV